MKKEKKVDLESDNLHEEVEQSVDCNDSKEEVNNEKKCCEDHSSKQCCQEEVLESEVIEEVDNEEKLKKQVKDLQDKLLRNAAELENFKKRITDEKIKERKYSSLNLCSNLLTPLGNYARALNVEANTDELVNFLQGFKMIYNQIFDILKADGVEEINPENADFDPNFHQSVAVEKVEDKDSGVILEVFEKGYKYKDRVLKPAMVKINE